MGNQPFRCITKEGKHYSTREPAECKAFIVLHYPDLLLGLYGVELYPPLKSIEYCCTLVYMCTCISEGMDCVLSYTYLERGPDCRVRILEVTTGGCNTDQLGSRGVHSWAIPWPPL